MVNILEAGGEHEQKGKIFMENDSLTITLKGLAKSDLHFHLRDLLQLPMRFANLAQFGIGVAGSGFLVSSLYESIKGAKAEAPEGIRVEAVDGFYAVIPWAECQTAFFQHAGEKGEVLGKGGPLRLYVPNGSSECLNVKSVICIEFLTSEVKNAEFGNMILRFKK